MSNLIQKWSFELDGIRRHKLMTEKIAKATPAIGESDFENPKIALKLFCILNRYTFLVTEFDGNDLLFGYCISQLGPDCDEWGYASLTELASQNLKGCPVIERDLYLQDQTVEEYLNKDTAPY